MRKKLVSTFIALAIGFLFTDVSAQKEVAVNATKINPADSTLKISGNMVVPANQTFYVYDENRQLIGTYTGGNTVIVPASKSRKKKELACAKIPCPKSFRKGTTCWECR